MDHAPRTRTARAIWACRWSADAARLPLCIPTPSPARRRACSRLDNIEPVRFDSLTYACDASGIIALIAGSRHRHSRRPSSFRHRSTPEVPFLDRHYPASSVVRTSPPPRPAQPCPHGVPVGACHTTDRASRVAPIPLFHACRRQYPGGTSRCACRSLPGQWQPSPTYRRGRLPHSRFRGLLSVHSRCGPHGRWITLGDPLHRSASNDVVTSIIRSDCYRLERQFAGRDSHPLRDGAFPRHTVRNQVDVEACKRVRVRFRCVSTRFKSSCVGGSVTRGEGTAYRSDAGQSAVQGCCVPHFGRECLRGYVCGNATAHRERWRAGPRYRRRISGRSPTVVRT